MKSLEAENLQKTLSGFHGTSCYYSYMGWDLTDGIKHLCETGRCFWLIDAILSLQSVVEEIYLEKHKQKFWFQCWKLKVGENFSGVLTCYDGNYDEIFELNFEKTNFILDEIEIWVQHSDMVIYLPSEH